MPVYLLHGFRWPRPLIRIHIILQDLDDAAAEWLVAPGTTACLLENLQELYPDMMEHLLNLRFIEQYDPADTSPTAASQPYAYVADVVHEIKLGLDVDEIRGKGVTNEQWGSILELRDKLAPEEKVGWFVVVCGDEERVAPEPDESLENGQHSHTLPYRVPPPEPYRQPSYGQQSIIDRERGRQRRSEGSSTYTASVNTQKDLSSPEAPQKGFKKFVGMVRRKSRVGLRDLHNSRANTSPPPPLPVNNR